MKLTVAIRFRHSLAQVDRIASRGRAPPRVRAGARDGRKAAQASRHISILTMSKSRGNDSGSAKAADQVQRSAQATRPAAPLTKTEAVRELEALGGDGTGRLHRWRFSLDSTGTL